MLDLVSLIGTLVITWLLGTMATRNHLKSLRGRESELRHIQVFSAETAPPQAENCDCHLVSGTAVMSLDYFRRFVESLMQLVGGRMTSYENLLDRARREAMVRMKDNAARIGAKRVFNVKIQTAHVYTRAKNGQGSFEIIAYGTALVPRKQSP